MVQRAESTQERLSRVAATVDERRGRDFSRMRTERDPVPWDYLDVACSYLKPTDAILDIGTGGGEKLLALSPHVAMAVGIDPNPEMIRVARENGSTHPNVTFAEMRADALTFPAVTFDVVLNRHAPIMVPEVIRVLKPGGYFVTQQVGAANMANIREEVGVGLEHLPKGSHLDDDDHRARIDQITGHGCRIVATGAYNVHYWVKDIPSLIFWFKAIAGGAEIPAGFSVDRDWQAIDRIITKHSTPNGILTNEHRTLLIAQKQAAGGPSP